MDLNVQQFTKEREQNGLKPFHTIGKVSSNASILYKNQEICNTTQPVKISAHFVISFTRKP